MMAIMQAEGGEKKDSILKESLGKFGEIQEAAPMLNMMMYQVIRSYAAENSTNPVPAVTKYIEEHSYNFNILFDLKNPKTKRYEVVESYGPKGLPAKYIIDKEDNIRFKLVGFSGSDEQAVSEISTMIDLLL